MEKLLPHGKAKAENVAGGLALSLRTLARRLADEGTTYGEVVDQLRKSLADGISQRSGDVARADCVAARIRGFDLIQSCFQTLDRTVAFR